MYKRIEDAVRKSPSGIIIISVSILIALCILFIPLEKSAPMSLDLSDYSSVSAICEFATIRNFYHNVVMLEEKPDGFNKFANDVLAWPFGSYTRFGYKQYWLEYSGIVEAGIDASQIQIIGPDENNIVKAYVPEARVLNVYADEESLSNPISETGLFTSISGEEEIRAFSAAQMSMREEAESDQAMLHRARENAKKMLEKYIINTGMVTGQELTVVWITSPQT